MPPHVQRDTVVNTQKRAQSRHGDVSRSGRSNAHERAATRARGGASACVSRLVRSRAPPLADARRAHSPMQKICFSPARHTSHGTILSAQQPHASGVHGSLRQTSHSQQQMVDVPEQPRQSGNEA